MFKASAVLSAIFVAEELGYIKVDHNILFTCIILVLIYVRLCMVWAFIGDPFIPLENLFCSIVFGGMLEALQQVLANDKVQKQNGEDHKLKRS